MPAMTQMDRHVCPQGRYLFIYGVSCCAVELTSLNWGHPFDLPAKWKWASELFLGRPASSGCCFHVHSA